MTSDIVESSAKKFLIKWLSFTIVKFLTKDQKILFKSLEKENEKRIKLKSHLKFNECCLINKLLPKYTDIIWTHFKTFKNIKFWENEYFLVFC